MSSSFGRPFSCRLSCHPFSKPNDSLFYRDLSRSSSRPRILYLRLPKRDAPLPSLRRHDLHNLLRCVRLCVSACRCNYFCLPLASVKLLSTLRRHATSAPSSTYSLVETIEAQACGRSIIHLSATVQRLPGSVS